jgi:hypothetical protein
MVDFASSAVVANPKTEGMTLDAAVNSEICDNAFIPTLFKKRAACQVCVFRLTDDERKKAEKNGRHLRVIMTCGGCINCKAFPSQQGEDPVRVCRQCFFDTHKLKQMEEKPFGGLYGLAGITPIYSSSRKGHLPQSR